MIQGHTVCVVMPAYNAAQTLRQTYQDLPLDVVDRVLLVDDRSDDATVRVARELGIQTFLHQRNRGYGGNQKTCYREALRGGEDIVIMVHPDYQYAPRLVTAMASLIATGEFDVVLGSRILGVGARQGGMPLYKYISNRVLTLVENWLLQYKLSEYHTGYRAFHRRVLESLPLLENSDDFVFDNQMLVQIIRHPFRVAEVTCPTRYFPEASSINFARSVKYGFGCLNAAAGGCLDRLGIHTPRFLRKDGRRLGDGEYVEVREAPDAGGAGSH
jgi:glycosyltransferase involved in cell wall biosynthesis